MIRCQTHFRVIDDLAVSDLDWSRLITSPYFSGIDHIEEIRQKTEGAYQTILTVAQDCTFKNIEMEIFWKLLEVSIHSILLYSCETWDLRKSDIMDSLNHKFNSSNDLTSMILKVKYNVWRQQSYD